MDNSIDYLDLHKKINEDHIKRFFLKPDCSQAIKDLDLMIKNLENEECPLYAALFLKNKAMIYRLSDDLWSMCASRVAAAEKLLESHNHDKQTNSVTYREKIYEAQELIFRCIDDLEKNNFIPIACNMYLYCADFLKNNFMFESAINCLSKAASLVPKDTLISSYIYSKLILLLIKTSDYVGALEACEVILELLEQEAKTTERNTYSPLLISSEIYRVLLTLLICPKTFDERQVKKSMNQEKSLLSNYLSIVEDMEVVKKPFQFFPEEVYLCLSSFIFSYLENDSVEMEKSSTYLVKFLDKEQSDLLRLLTMRFYNPQGKFE